MSIKLALFGASGRMGSLVKEIVAVSDDLELLVSLNSADDPKLSLGADLLVDFTNPSASEQIAKFAIEHNLRLLIGSSGWSREKIEKLSSQMSKSLAAIAIVPNFSVGSVLTTEFVAKASKFFDSVSIVETHHVSKVDAPSGTALYTAKAIAESRKQLPSATNPNDAPMFEGVPIKSVRIDERDAKQSVSLQSEFESINVEHTVSSLQAYRDGILLAVRAMPKQRGLIVGLASFLAEG